MCFWSDGMTGRVRTSLTTKAAAVAVLAVLLPTVTARADIFTSPAPAQGSGSAAAPPPDRNWYGGQILAADLASIGALSLCFGHRQRLLRAGPHSVGHGRRGHPRAGHGDPARAVLSVALHAGLPIAGWYLGSATCPECSDEGNIFPGLGVLIGTVLATVLDAAFSDESTPRGPGGSRPSGPTLTPTIDTTGGGLGLGLAGSF